MNGRHGVPLVLAAILSVVMLGGNIRAAEGDAKSDLNQAEEFIKAGRWTEARIALARAEGRLASGGQKELRQRAEQMRRDLEMVARLEEIRLGLTDGKKAAEARYAEAFRALGIDVEKLDKAARRVRDSAIQNELLEGLDSWAMANPAGETRKTLLALANRLDDSSWRKRLRRAVQEKNLKALREIAANSEAQKQSPTMLVFLAEALRQADQTGEAIGVLRRAQLNYPADFWINYYLAALLVRQRTSRDEAVGFYRAALALRPAKPQLYVALGSAMLGQGKPHEAIHSFRKAIELEPKEASAHVKLAVALSTLGKMAEAVACCRKGIDLEPANAAAHLQLGTLLLQLGSVAEAEACFRNSLRLDPQSASAYASLGKVMTATGRMNEAIQCFRKAIELDPKGAPHHLRLGNILHRVGKVDEAIACYRKAIELDPRFAAAHYNLGLACRDKGQLDEAISCYRKALELQPNLAPAKKAIEAALKSKADR